MSFLGHVVTYMNGETVSCLPSIFDSKRPGFDSPFMYVLRFDLINVYSNHRLAFGRNLTTLVNKNTKETFSLLSTAYFLY